MPLLTDRDKCAHLLRRFGLGASEAELDYYLKGGGLRTAIDRLIDPEGPDGFPLDIEALRGGKNSQIRMPSVVNWWIARMAVSNHPVREKMTLFWHDHFATSASKVQVPMMMYGQNELIRSNCLGNFRQLLKEVSKDPAMIFWLDNQLNVKGRPNENFAREVMELFTLGIGHYTERDVQEGARAFTGWSIRRAGTKGPRGDFLYRPFQHDAEPKQFLGNGGRFDGDDVLNILCDNPRTAEYITWKIWDWFVWANPDEATIAPFAERFRKSGLEIKALLRDIMQSREFYSARAERVIVKNPVDFVIATVRQLGIGQQIRSEIPTAPDGEFPRIAMLPAASAQAAMKGMGMSLLFPPDVAGWDNGQAWITSATIVERIGWADKLFGTARTIKFPIRYAPYELFEQDPTPAGVARRLVSIFDAPMRPERFPILKSAAEKASGGRVTEANAGATAQAVSKLIFASPEFQFS